MPVRRVYETAMAPGGTSVLSGAACIGAFD